MAGLDLGPAAQLLAEISGRNPAEWDITECSFISNFTIQDHPGAEAVRFLTFDDAQAPYKAGMPSLSDKGGRRKVYYRFPYRDGQTSDDMGRKGESFSLNVIFYGDDYKKGLKALLAECDQPSVGILQHPVRGRIVVGFDDYELVHQYSERKAVTARLMFTENTFTIDSIADKAPNDISSVKTALVAAVAAIRTVDTIINKVRSTIFATNEIRKRIEASLTSYKNGYFLGLQRINVTFNNNGSADLPMLVPVNDGGIAGPTGTIRRDTYTVALSLNDPFRGLPDQYNQPLPVTTQQAIDMVAGLRVQANDNIVLLKTSLKDGSGPLEFYNEILQIIQTAIAMQSTLESGIASSKQQIAQYVTKRLMTVREVAFDIGIGANRSIEIEILNPALLSVNFIERGTSLQVPLQ